MNKPLLDGLDDVDWYALSHAYGVASNVPQMLRRLCSNDRQDRDEAWSDLWGAVYHQGSIYSSTPVVARFLVDLAGHSAVPDRTTLLDNLYFWVPGADCGPLNEKELDEFSWEVVNAIRAGLPLYIGLLHDDDPTVRSRAGWLITHCAPVEIDRAANAIREQVEQEQDASALAELALALGTFRRTADASLLRNLVANVQQNVRAAAAIAWIQIVAEVPTAAAAVLVDASRPPGDQFVEIEQWRVKRWFVTEALHKLRSCEGEYAQVLLNLFQAENDQLRKSAVYDLNGWNTTSWVKIDILKRALNDDSDHMMRISAALGIQDLFETAFDANPMYEHAPRTEWRLNAQRAARVLAPQGAEALAERLWIEPDENLKRIIIETLMHGAMWAEPAVKILKHLAGGDNQMLADRANNTLEVIETIHTRNLDRLVRFLAGFSSGVSRAAEEILLELAQKDPEQVIERVTAALDQAPAAQKRAARLLAQLGSVAAGTAPKLKKLLRSKFADVRNAAANALRAIAPADPDPRPVTGVAELRARLGPQTSDDVVKLIADLVNDEDNRAQRKSTWQLAQMGAGANAALPFLESAMQKPFLRYFAAGAIARIQPERIRPLIPELLYEFRLREDERLNGTPLLGNDVLPFLSYLGPELQPDAISYLLDSLPGRSEHPPYPAARMIKYAVQHLMSAPSEALIPLMARLLDSTWDDDEARGFDSACTRMLKLLKSKGPEFGPLIFDVARYRDDKKLAPLAIEVLSRIGTWRQTFHYLAEALESRRKEVRDAAEAFFPNLIRSATARDREAIVEALRSNSKKIKAVATDAFKLLDAQDNS